MSCQKPCLLSASIGLIAAAFLLMASPVASQVTTAVVEGIVSDETGAILPGVLVTATSVDVGLSRTAVTEGVGRYRIPALPPGGYRVTAMLQGFATVTRDLTLTIGQDAVINFSLKLRAVQESITVAGEAPLVETTKSTLGETIRRKDIDELPLSARNYTNLAVLAPGVNTEGGLSAAGQNFRNNSYLVDGVNREHVGLSSLRGELSADSIQEFQVITNQFSAEYGLATGAVLNVITRSGTNQLRGRWSTFIRSNALDARNVFARGEAPFDQQQFGGFLGGPIVRNKTFYFGSYEANRVDQTAVVTSPLAPGEFPQDTRQHKALAKLTHQLHSENLLSLVYDLDRRLDHNTGVGGLTTIEQAVDSLVKNQDFVGSWSSILSSHALNEMRFSTAGYVTDRVPLTKSGPDIRRPSGRFGKASNMPQAGKHFYLEFQNNFSYSAENLAGTGSHDIKAGVDWYRGRINLNFSNNLDGIFTFSTDQPFDPTNASTYPSQFDRNIGDPFIQTARTTTSLFVQDSWKPRRNLTVNLGFRYDHDNQESPVGSRTASWDSYAPRFAFAWDPLADGKTSIRGGYGMFNDGVFGTVMSNIKQASGFVQVVIANPGFPDPLGFNPRGTRITNPTPSTTIAAFDGHVPHTATASIGVSRQVVPDLAVSADYVHTRGRNLLRSQDVNAPDAATRVRPNPSFVRVMAVETNANSWYDALQLQVTKRFSRRYQFTTAYTLANALRDTEDWSFSPSNQFDPTADKGPANSDVRHVLAVSSIVSFPLGFQIGIVGRTRSALPYTITTGLDNNGDSFFTDRPAGVGRNSERGSSFLTVDVRISKFFTIRSVRIEGLAEAFNLLNRANFGTPVGNVRSASFGKPTTAQDPRQIQLGFRIDF